MKPILVEIWSDVVCPFCYIGKRQFEAALARFPGKDAVTVEWKSYQLDPSVKTDPNQKTLERLAAKYGWTQEAARQAMRRVEAMAEDVGLSFRLEDTKVVNTFDAHRFTHFARAHGRQNEAEDALFQAHFCEGANTADAQTLLQIGTRLKLPSSELQSMLAGNSHEDAVKDDLARARSLGIQGVPFFLFNQSLAVSGAQGSDVFLQALARAGEASRP
jgi:predicted DsbA family dithiol-disulfide isomerase